MPERPFVSVIVPCRSEAACIEKCLETIIAQEVPEGGFEVLVADGMSDDGTREILARLGTEARSQRSEVSGPVIRVIDNQGLIVSAGLNAAIRAARGTIIIRMDAHTEYAPNYINLCIEATKATGADNVGGPWVARGNCLISNAIAAAFQSPFAVGGARGHDTGYTGFVDTVYLGCWHRQAFEKFGLFDEELVRNQDDEHNLRIIRAGGRVFQSSEIKSWYRPRGSLSSLFKQYMQYGYWKVRVIQKHKLPASWRHLVPGAFVLVLSALFLLSAFCFLLSLWSASCGPVVSSPWSMVHSWSHFCFLLSAFCFLFICSAYFLAVLAASVVTSAKTEWKLFPVLPVVFGCYHLGYGFGFLRGILSFVILRRRGSRAFAKLTRGSLKTETQK